MLVFLLSASASAADYDNIAKAEVPAPARDGDAAFDASEAMDVAVDDLPRSVSISMPRAPVHAATVVRTHRTDGRSDLILAVAQRYRIDPHLLAAVVRTESAGNGRAVSRKGALGLMQVMPATAKSLGVDDPQRLLTDPSLALEVGATYLKMLQARLGNNVPLVLAAYNAGPGAVVRAGMRIPAYRETQAYVGKVMAGYAASRAAALR
jgi:soluble lytic murein transglycosylase-like protein